MRHPRFQTAYGDRAYTAIAFAMNEEFGRVLQRQMEFYNSPNADQFGIVQKKLDDVRNVMVRGRSLLMMHTQ
jgi:hypothetical protein